MKEQQILDIGLKAASLILVVYLIIAIGSTVSTNQLQQITAYCNSMNLTLQNCNITLLNS